MYSILSSCRHRILPSSRPGVGILSWNSSCSKGNWACSCGGVRLLSWCWSNSRSPSSWPNCSIPCSVMSLCKPTLIPLRSRCLCWSHCSRSLLQALPPSSSSSCSRDAPSACFAPLVALRFSFHVSRRTFPVLLMLSRTCCAVRALLNATLILALLLSFLASPLNF